MKVIIERPGRIGKIVNIEQGDGGTVNLGERVQSRVADDAAVPEPGVGADEALCDLLVSLFDVNRLREWLTFRGDADVLNRLPNNQASPLRLLCFEFVTLQRRVGGLTADFFSDLMAEFPGRSRDISRVRDRALGSVSDQRRSHGR
jgi:hypothetical protein